MVIFFARGLIQTFIIRSDELELLFDCAMYGPGFEEQVSEPIQDVQTDYVPYWLPLYR